MRLSEIKVENFADAIKDPKKTDVTVKLSAILPTIQKMGWKAGNPVLRMRKKHNMGRYLRLPLKVDAVITDFFYDRGLGEEIVDRLEDVVLDAFPPKKYTTIFHPEDIFEKGGTAYYDFYIDKEGDKYVDTSEEEYRRLQGI